MSTEGRYRKHSIFYGGVKEHMAVVYVIQVMARHGVGSQGWRTVRRSSGEPYCFQTHAAALTALRKHFSVLCEERDVRVRAITEEPESSSSLAAPPSSHRQ
jgi:hypothetical protein